VDVVMQPEAVQVEEVVVTALGIKRAEKATGYAIQSVNGDDIAKLVKPMWLTLFRVK